MSKTILITGGARSGKSSFGEELIKERGENILYVATAKPIDEEMKDRIKKHRERRPSYWDTLEQYSGLGAVLPEKSKHYDGILLDCVTIMSTNIIFDLPFMQQAEIPFEQYAQAENHLMGEIKALTDSFDKLQCDLIMVTNEVGLGLVPEYPISRFYRDALGRVNQALGKACDEAYFVSCGIPLKLK